MRKDYINRNLKRITVCEQQIESWRELIAGNELAIKSLKENLAEMIDETMLRPITTQDVVEGQLFFGKNTDGFYVLKIKEVWYPGDDFKAWVADDGCRYGLYKHFVLNLQPPSGREENENTLPS